MTLRFAGLRRAVGPKPSTAHARPRFKGWRRAPCWTFWLHCHPLERVPPGESQMSANDPTPSRPRPESESTQINDAVGWFLDGCGGSPADRGALRCSVSVRLLQAEHKVPRRMPAASARGGVTMDRAESGSKVVSQAHPRSRRVRRALVREADPQLQVIPWTACRLAARLLGSPAARRGARKKVGTA